MAVVAKGLEEEVTEEAAEEGVGATATTVEFGEEGDLTAKQVARAEFVAAIPREFSQEHSSENFGLAVVEEAAFLHKTWPEPRPRR